MEGLVWEVGTTERMGGLVAGESGVVWTGWYGGSALEVNFLFSLFFPRSSSFSSFSSFSLLFPLILRLCSNSTTLLLS